MADEEKEAPIAAFPMWAKVTMFLGFPTVACTAMAYGIWTMVLWGRDHVAEPVVKSHLAFMAESTVHMQKGSDAMRSVADSMAELRKGQKATERYLREIVEGRGAHVDIENSPGPGGIP